MAGVARIAGVLVVASAFLLSPARVAAATTPQQGIDVSSFQGTINWGAVAGSGVTFAYIRAAYGGSVPDDNFQTNWQGAEAAGVTRGAYLYFVPSQDANAQANLLLQQLHAVNFTAGDIVPAIDVEETDNQSAATIVSELHTVVNDVAGGIGAAPAIYTSPVWWDGHIASSDFVGNPLWIANWCGSCTSPGLPANNWGGNGYQAWQYADNGSVAGISGNVDLDRGNPALPWYGGRPPVTLGSGPLGGTPHPVSWGQGQMDVFWRGTDNELWHTWYTAQNGWQGPEGLGGHLASDPYPVVTQVGVIDVFWKGVDGNLWHTWYVDHVGWRGAQSLGDGPLGSDPQPVSWGNGRVDVFWKGTNANLWHAYYDGKWNGPQSNGIGPLGSKPHPVSWGPNRIDVFWEGSDANLWHAYDVGSAWHGPEMLGDGPLASEPYPVSDAAGILDIFWRGTDNGLWHAFYVSGTWYTAQSLASVYSAMNSDPAPMSIAPNQYAIFWTDANNQLWDVTYNAGWHRPTFRGGGPVPAQAMVATHGTGDVEVFWEGTDGALWYKAIAQPSS